MKALLMHRDRDFDLRQELPFNEAALTQDLELETLFRAMAGDDGGLFEVARQTLFSGLRNDLDTVLYRQAILQDTLKAPTVVRTLYTLAVEAIEAKKKSWFGVFSHSPGPILHGSIELLQMFVDLLRRLRGVAQEHAGRFQSPGFTTLFSMLEKELTEDYLARIEAHLTALKFHAGILVSAELGSGNEGRHYVLRKPRGKAPNWLQRLLGKSPPAYTFRIGERDEIGANTLLELRNRSVHLVANALAQSADHILNFFQMLLVELAFYVGCLNLYDRLTAKGQPLCFPQPMPAGERRHRCNGLYDVCLSLHMDGRVVGNSMDADGKNLVIITGANRGGKSSFLRAVALAQLMMQCGMFVPAESFSAELCPGVFTHYRRKEDTTLQKGKLDEELARMSDIADHLTANSCMFFNESFTATNEREGSEIAKQVIQALLEKRIKVFFVTHLYEFAHDFAAKKMRNVVFLRAERQADGNRTFKLTEGEPLETSYGEDLYQKIFAGKPQETRTA